LLLQVCGNSLLRINQQSQQNQQNNVSKDSVDSNPYENLDDVEDEDFDYDNSREADEDEDKDDDDEYEIDHAAETELKDATIKLVRLLANISIDADVGMEVGSKRENLETLLELLMSSTNNEEMLLNVVAALTNLTYYSCQVSHFVFLSAFFLTALY
jgi:hypothetical protein